jgi:flagellar hook-length control protein FliK
MQALALNTPVSSADFQALQQIAPASEGKTDTDLLAKMENVQLQTGSAQAVQAVTVAPPPSTLSVLSMMDATLRSEDIESLKKEFDNFHGSTDAIAGAPDLPTPAGVPEQRATHQPGLTTAQVFADRPDLAQAYENLSNKLSTELAARMHEKLNAGEWKMKFALKPASLGLVDVQLEMRDGKLSAQFQSDTPLTQELIQNGSQRLKDALADLGLNNASVFVSQGQSQSGGQAGQQAPSGLPVQRGENRAKLTEQPGAKIAENSAPKRNKRSQFDSYA